MSDKDIISLYVSVISLFCDKKRGNCVIEISNRKYMITINYGDGIMISQKVVILYSNGWKGQCVTFGVNMRVISNENMFIAMLYDDKAVYVTIYYSDGLKESHKTFGVNMA